MCTEKSSLVSSHSFTLSPAAGLSLFPAQPSSGERAVVGFSLEFLCFPSLITAALAPGGWSRGRGVPKSREGPSSLVCYHLALGTQTVAPIQTPAHFPVMRICGFSWGSPAMHGRSNL